uniref:Uncharacterized protein n=1 Tax=Zooxanthella nutricula TaxID=1333877 RepID=A0A7S2PPW5_9DINO|mmetsp:Transcript_62760/g.191979  ORF Transcript_62760/g.191979 Transcript_62760/m.191979 type:complete len:409 (+) Transcript_62760:2-1228(+)
MKLAASELALQRQSTLELAASHQRRWLEVDVSTAHTPKKGSPPDEATIDLQEAAEPRGAPSGARGSLESQVETLRRQVQDMVRVMPAPQAPALQPQPAAQHTPAPTADVVVRAVDTCELSPTALRLFDTQQALPTTPKAAVPDDDGAGTGTEASTAMEEEELAGAQSFTALLDDGVVVPCGLPHGVASSTGSFGDVPIRLSPSDSSQASPAPERLPNPATPRQRLMQPLVATARAEDTFCTIYDCAGQRPGLSLRDLSEIKALKKPPPPIRMLMEVCCILFHIQPTKCPDEKSTQGRLRQDYWEPARRYLLSDPFFLQKLRTHDDTIQPAQRARIRKYFKDPEFTAERVRKCSKAAYELYCWIGELVKEPSGTELAVSGAAAAAHGAGATGVEASGTARGLQAGETTP